MSNRNPSRKSNSSSERPSWEHWLIKIYASLKAVFNGCVYFIALIRTNVCWNGCALQGLSLREFYVFVMDSLVAFFSLYGTVLLCEEDVGEYSSGFLVKNMLVFVCLFVSIALVLGTPKLVAKLRVRSDYIALAIAWITTTAIFYPLMYLMGQLESLSMMTPVFNVFMGLALSSLPRVFAEKLKRPTLLKHNWISFRLGRLGSTAAKPHLAQIEVLLVGEYPDIEQFFTWNASSSYKEFIPVAIVTPQADDFGRYIHDVPVIGSFSAMSSILTDQEALGFQYIFIVGGLMSDKNLRTIEENAQRANIPVLRVPHLAKIEQRA